MKPVSTHWGTDGELHCGGLDECLEMCCIDRRYMAVAFERPVGR